MKIIYNILLVVLIICIPFVSLITSFNVVLRMPDLYVYEFNNTEITDEIDLEVTGDELGHFFSDYMFGKNQEFKLFAEYRGREQAVFGTGEQISMEHARKLLNISLFALAGFVFFTIIGYAVFLLKKRKLALRYAFKGAVIFYIVLIVLIIIAFHVTAVRESLHQLIFIYPSGADDVMPLVLTKKFAGDSITAGIVGGSILLIMLASITWKATKPRRMFWQ